VIKVEQNNVVGIVSEREKNTLLKFYERKLAIEELFLSLNENYFIEEDKNIFINKVSKNMKETKDNIEKWWTEKSNKYSWEGKKSGFWEINFQTNEIILRG
jgi:CXXX repeat modification system protein